MAIDTTAMVIMRRLLHVLRYLSNAPNDAGAYECATKVKYAVLLTKYLNLIENTPIAKNFKKEIAEAHEKLDWLLLDEEVLNQFIILEVMSA